GLAEYFKLAAPSSAYGAAGSLAAVMLWVYYSAFILFFGAEFTKVWTLDRDRTVRIEPFAVPAEK
ncbi:MAG TPA: YhjD/YihY/BrkB family envelope integrity protein, partial [Tepidisphaeraceae bacterium]|nr:YhjD/YihY/BrkB family envelope integrity protein [Tepidisphaeraceae bacterium]